LSGNGNDQLAHSGCVMVALRLCVCTAQVCSGARSQVQITTSKTFKPALGAAHRAYSRAVDPRQVVGLANISDRIGQGLAVRCKATGQNVVHVSADGDMGYRQNVGVCVVNREGLVFAARSAADPRKRFTASAVIMHVNAPCALPAGWTCFLQAH
jgi:hypothetical protein